MMVPVGWTYTPKLVSQLKQAASHTTAPAVQEALAFNGCCYKLCRNAGSCSAPKLTHASVSIMSTPYITTSKWWAPIKPKPRHSKPSVVLHVATCRSTHLELSQCCPSLHLLDRDWLLDFQALDVCSLLCHNAERQIIELSAGLWVGGDAV